MKARIAAAVAAGACAVLTMTATTASAADDVTAPVQVSADAGAFFRNAAGVTLKYEFKDPGTEEEPGSGLTDYDVRYQEKKLGEQEYGEWVQPAEWQKTTATTVTHTAERGTETCFQVRARDVAGNESAWSEYSACSVWDGTPPVYTGGYTSGRVSTDAFWRVWFHDDSATDTTVDVAYRDLVPGKPRGPWVYPDNWHDQRRSDFFWDSVPGVDRCVSARGRDWAGNVSSWTPETCVLAPWDDRSFTTTGTVSRVLEPSSYRGTATTLKSNGAALVKTGEIGKQIALVATHGPGQGTVDVYHAGVKLGRVSLAASATEYKKVTYLPVGVQRTGEVRIVSVSTDPAVIDGVGVIKL
ncbi:hypothetical protein GCM10029976_078870 [Kribbella albertanoniae]|uniref:Fibronectin type-III domain-containing protein n=1 Tax=Kribbella albertanoniae TaxID=1266829 RepID=A0A4R4QA00_9ACTN|nr:hypothetical protein [Kribbella albertanoniae]TDC32201.1 hypothetical protein E1261_09180 [Kribbella albertanoniae]